MNVVVVHGSPRRQGNSSYMAHMLVNNITNADITHVYLYDLTFKGCKGCMFCRKKTETCVIEDDLTDVLHSIRTADVTVLASPIYQGGITGELKCLIDRFFSYLSTDHFQKRQQGVYPIPSRLGPGKIAVLVFAQGQDEQAYGYLVDQVGKIMITTGFTHVEFWRGCLLNRSKDSRARPELLDEAHALADRIMFLYQRTLQ